MSGEVLATVVRESQSEDRTLGQTLEAMKKAAFCQGSRECSTGTSTHGKEAVPSRARWRERREKGKRVRHKAARPHPHT